MKNGFGRGSKDGACATTSEKEGRRGDRLCLHSADRCHFNFGGRAICRFLPYLNLAYCEKRLLRHISSHSAIPISEKHCWIACKRNKFLVLKKCNNAERDHAPKIGPFFVNSRQMHRRDGGVGHDGHPLSTIFPSPPSVLHPIFGGKKSVHCVPFFSPSLLSVKNMAALKVKTGTR